MKRSKKKKLNIFKLVLALLLLLVILLGLFKFIKIISKDKKVLMSDVVGENINMAMKDLKNYQLDIDLKYEYSDYVIKDDIISQSIDSGMEIHADDKLNLIVSLGKLDKEKLKKDGINELGKVPIMMYHGIKNMTNSETNYTGGNVDKDGYTRTVEAFRKDLEFYYQNGYRMIKLSDYINGNIDVEYGKSPIILTFDDGNDNNIKVTGLDEKGNIIIDKNSAVGVLEEYKKKYPDYNEKIIKWLIENGYEVGNHTKGHNNLSKTSESETEEVIGYVYKQLSGLVGDKYSKIVALPFGTPYNKEHANYKHVISGEYDGFKYTTEGALRVGWEPEVSPFDKNFDKTFLKRCRAYDNNGVDFDIKMVFRMLEKTRYVSDGDINHIVTMASNKEKVFDSVNKEVIYYE